MWTNNRPEVPSQSPTPAPSPEYRSVGAPSSVTPTVRPNGHTTRDLACLGPTLTIKGQITGDEDLQIDGKVDGPISLQGNRFLIRSFR